MDLLALVTHGTMLHGHACPPLVLGVRAGALAMERLGVGRAVDRELFAMVELGSDHYAQGFVDGVQVVTACTFGKELIARVPLGKLGVRLVDQVRGRAVRVAIRSEAVARLERSRWFGACSEAGRITGREDLSGPAIDALLAASQDELFSVGPVFPMGVEDPAPSFTSVTCGVCGERVLEPYATGALGGERLCRACEDRRLAVAR